MAENIPPELILKDGSQDDSQIKKIEDIFHILVKE